jgi:hypothetical protein
MAEWSLNLGGTMRVVGGRNRFVICLRIQLSLQSLFVEGEGWVVYLPDPSCPVIVEDSGSPIKLTEVPMRS